MNYSRLSFFSILFIALAIIGLLHMAGVYLFWYWRLGWFDIVVHTLGGFWVGGMALWFYYLSGFMGKRTKTPFRVVAIALVSTIAVGILWEVFEVMIGAIYVEHEKYWIDTPMDLVADSVGALLVAAYFLKKEKHEEIIQLTETQ